MSSRFGAKNVQGVSAGMTKCEARLKPEVTFSAKAKLAIMIATVTIILMCSPVLLLAHFQRTLQCIQKPARDPMLISKAMTCNAPATLTNRFSFVSVVFGSVMLPVLFITEMGLSVRD